MSGHHHFWLPHYRIDRIRIGVFRHACLLEPLLLPYPDRLDSSGICHLTSQSVGWLVSECNTCGECQGHTLVLNHLSRSVGPGH